METDGKTLVAMIEEKTLLLLGVESCLPRFNESLFQFSKLILAFFLVSNLQLVRFLLPLGTTAVSSSNL